MFYCKTGKHSFKWETWNEDKINMKRRIALVGSMKWKEDIIKIIWRRENGRKLYEKNSFTYNKEERNPMKKILNKCYQTKRKGLKMYVKIDRRVTSKAPLLWILSIIVVYCLYRIFWRVYVSKHFFYIFRVGGIYAYEIMDFIWIFFVQFKFCRFFSYVW